MEEKSPRSPHLRVCSPLGLKARFHSHIVLTRSSISTELFSDPTSPESLRSFSLPVFSFAPSLLSPTISPALFGHVPPGQKRLMSTITDHGGDVLRLAGDALIVAFTGKSKLSRREIFQRISRGRPNETTVAEPVHNVCFGKAARAALRRKSGRGT